MAVPNIKNTKRPGIKKPAPQSVAPASIPPALIDSSPEKRSRWGYAVALAVALSVLCLSAWTAHYGHAMGWEYSWFVFVNNVTDRLLLPAQVITFLGSTSMVLAATVVAFLLRCYQFAWRFAFTALGAYAVVAVLKHVIDRERPIGLFQDIHVRVTETAAGFPSGHATIITVLMLTLAPFIPRAWRWLVALPIAAVCISRLYLGVHIPLDLIGGLAIGTAAVAFVQVLPLKVRTLLRL